MIGTPFSDLDDYVRLPRISGLRLSPDGTRLVYVVDVPDSDKNRYVSALWEVDSAGRTPARRLTWGTEGESGAAFLPGGDLLFLAKRPDRKALWRLPAKGGEARQVVAPGGGVNRVLVSTSGTVVVAAPLFPSAADPAQDEEIRARRDEAGVTAILYEESPVRYWDHQHGPDWPRLLAVEDDQLRDITGHIGRALGEEQVWDISPDGSTIVASWLVGEPSGSQRNVLMAVDVATGERRALVDDPDYEYYEPRISPDGTQVAFVVLRRSTPQDLGDRWLAVIPLAGGEPRTLTTEWDRWPRSPRWTPDGRTLIVAADDNGRVPLWRVDVETGASTRLTTDNGSYAEAQVGPEGRWVYALCSAINSPPTPVRISLDAESTVEHLIDGAVQLPGRLEEFTTTAADGTTIRGWLALPETDEPAPLLLWVHGGPYMSWNTWSWRWNPWLAVARGYAVLQPDPALSTGYGKDFVRRGWGEWGGTPYTDLMSITDAALERPDIDEGRTAAMGASFGGYMANWIAGHTDRFDAIVTHASLWAMDQMMGTTDQAFDFVREMTEEAADANSPHRFADKITTPMLVIHGDKDYRVPVGEGLRLWWDLSSRAGVDNPHKFLYFPDENHWILTPNHAKVWYSTIFAFLAHHVLSQPWQRPEHLG